jgi:hypothetical protein
MQRQDDVSKESDNSKVENTNPENKPNQEPIIEDIPQLSNKPSITTPNYWIIPVESMTADGMQKVISDKAVEANRLFDGELAEFLVTDSKNNPVSFSAFCILSGISLPSQVFDSLEDSFSFYFYKDAGKARAGLAVKTKNSDKIIPLLSGVEKSMPADLKPLLLGETVSNPVKFNDSKYNTYSIRYFNINANGTSIDYSVNPSYLIIGTSMKTERAIISKVHP